MRTAAIGMIRDSNRRDADFDEVERIYNELYDPRIYCWADTRKDST